MTFIERYNFESTWFGKIIIMEIYYLARRNEDPNWTVNLTADYFQCSIGLVSENLKLARAFHSNPKLMNCESRAEALRIISNK